MKEMGQEYPKMTVESVKEKYEAQLLGMANVTGVGVGTKSGKEVIKVFVTRKIPELSLNARDVIPRTLDGCEVDVEEIGIVTSQTE
jgi:hypothetical protein